MRFLAAALLLCFVLPAPAQKNKNKKGLPELQVVSIKLHRESGLLSIEGSVKNISEKPMRGVVLFLEFLEAGNHMISRMQTDITEEELAPNEDREFLTQTPDPVRAVSVRLDAEDKEGRYLKVDKVGPYPID
jgi:hypothetical protein